MNEMETIGIRGGVESRAVHERHHVQERERENETKKKSEENGREPGVGKLRWKEEICNYVSMRKRKEM